MLHNHWQRHWHAHRTRCRCSGVFQKVTGIRNLKKKEHLVSDALFALTGDDFQTELSNLMTTYQEEHMDELISININDGNEAMMNKLFDDLMPEIMGIMKKSYDSYTPEDVNITFTLEKQNDIWMITNATLGQ